MSITSEISRLQTAKADIKAAIEGKGVTVPSGSTLDDFADLVEAIQTGGGGGGTLIESGTFTVATKSKNYDIVHNLGTAPNFCFIFPIDVHTDSDAYLIGSQTICSADFGQENWTIGTNATARPGGHAFGIGTGYSVSVHGFAGEGNELPFFSSATDLYYCGYFTDSIARVGNTNSTGGAGWLLGTYGYFLGVMPVATES